MQKGRKACPAPLRHAGLLVAVDGKEVRRRRLGSRLRKDHERQLRLRRHAWPTEEKDAAIEFDAERMGRYATIRPEGQNGIGQILVSNVIGRIDDPHVILRRFENRQQHLGAQIRQFGLFKRPPDPGSTTLVCLEENRPPADETSRPTLCNVPGMDDP